MDLRTACDLYLNSRRGLVSPATMRNYAESLSYPVRVLDNRPIESVTTDDLRFFRSFLFSKSTRYGKQRPKLDGPLSRHTIHGKLRVIRQLFRFLSEEGHLAGNPARRLELPSLADEPPKAITKEDIDRLIDAATDPRDRAILLFLATTGCRVGGLVGLRLADLDLKRGQAIVREKGRGGAKMRVVFLTEELQRALREWMEWRDLRQLVLRRKTDRVFVGRKGALTPAGVYKLIWRVAKVAHITGRHNPHSFRHAFARTVLDNGADLATVSQMMGHSSLVVTAKFYARWATAELQAKHARFAPKVGRKRKKT